MPLINVSDFVKRKLEAVREEEEHKSLDSVIRTLFRNGKKGALKEEMTLEYIAGLFDGEGYIGITKHIDNRNDRLALDPQIAISLAKGYDVLFHLQKFFGFGNIRHRVERRKNQNDTFEYYCKSQQECLDFISRVENKLKIKGEHAFWFKAFLISRMQCKNRNQHSKERPYSDFELQCYETLKQLNKRGT